MGNGRRLVRTWWSILRCLKLKYKEEFGSLVEIISDEDAAALQSSDEEINAALDAAIDAAINSVLEREYIGSLL